MCRQGENMCIKWLQCADTQQLDTFAQLYTTTAAADIHFLLIFAVFCNTAGRTAPAGGLEHLKAVCPVLFGKNFFPPDNVRTAYCKCHHCGINKGVLLLHVIEKKKMNKKEKVHQQRQLWLSEAVMSLLLSPAGSTGEILTKSGWNKLLVKFNP